MVEVCLVEGGSWWGFGGEEGREKGREVGDEVRDL